ncbi:hypothetical protein PIB30_063845 [Stylosanthes scabra]|uniref:Uncharacterized protein n=1 Tax=Stylosanthes scabra TaxID=79078 RepID=A0ABU6WL46_9FABA|nr:hypothetical protein [Stylosanthes scabra]
MMAVQQNNTKFVGTCWTSILMCNNNNKSKDEETVMNCIVKPLPPYVVANTKTCLSDKSLQICTESLGSETGSDHLLFSSSSSYNTTIPSHHRSQSQIQVQAQKPLCQEKVQQLIPKEDYCGNNNNLVVMNKCTPRSPSSSFPPPMPWLRTLSRRRDSNGRLFLEALPATVADGDDDDDSSHKNKKKNNKLCAQRQDGRLVLTFAAPKEEEEEEFEEDDNVVDEEEEEYEDDEEIEEANDDDDNNGDDDYLVQHKSNNSNSIISCKDSGMSFLLWEPHCIATS